MTTLEINTSDIFAINKLKKYAKEKFNFEINIVNEDSQDEKHYIWFEKDRERLQRNYKLMKAWKIKLYDEEEFSLEMDNFISNLKEKYV